MKRVNLGIIGLGFWGSNHARVIRDLEEAKLKAVCDINEERARNASFKYGAEYFTTDYNKLIRDDEINAVTVCTPANTLAKIASEALEGGKHVLIEKPMSLSVREAMSLLDSQKRSNMLLAVGLVERFNPAYTQVENILKRGELGEVIMTYGKRIGPGRLLGTVGIIFDTAIHDIDLAISTFGMLPESVYAVGGSLKHELEDHLQSCLTFGQSKGSIIEANWLTHKKKREMDITCEEGVIRINFLTQDLTIEKGDYDVSPRINHEEPLKLEIKNFVDRIKGKEGTIIPASDGIKSVIVAEAIKISINKKKVIYIEDIKEEVGIKI